MKRIIKLFCYIMIVLMASWSQADIISVVDCTHCLKVQAAQTQPECCSNMGAEREESYNAGLTGANRTCPHAGFCQNDVDTSGIYLVYSTTYEVGSPAVLSFITLSDLQEKSKDQTSSKLSYPIRKRPGLFTLNCSFLI